MRVMLKRKSMEFAIQAAGPKKHKTAHADRSEQDVESLVEGIKNLSTSSGG
jgi:hypothetical protein